VYELPPIIRAVHRVQQTGAYEQYLKVAVLL